MSYQSFKSRMEAVKRVDYDHVYSFQCVDLILQYVADEFGLRSGIWGNAIDYWNYADNSTPHKNLATKFDKIATTDCKQGDIVVLRGLAGNPYGHIGICDSQSASAVRLLEQNAAGSGTGTGKDAIGVWRDIPKSRVVGVWRPKPAAPAPNPAPNAPAARSTVFLPAAAGPWRLYRIGSNLRPNTSDQIARLRPDLFNPGLTYKIEGWVGDKAVNITTKDFGRGTIWVKDTSAVIK